MKRVRAIAAAVLSSTALANPAWAGAMVSCEVKTEPIGARLDVSSLGHAQLALVDRASKITYQCPLKLEHFVDRGAGRAPRYDFEFYRDGRCEPALPQSLEDGVKSEIRMVLSFLSETVSSESNEPTRPIPPKSAAAAKGAKSAHASGVGRGVKARFESRIVLFALHPSNPCHVAKASDFDLKFFARRFKPEVRKLQGDPSVPKRTDRQLPLKDATDPNFTLSPADPS